MYGKRPPIIKEFYNDLKKCIKCLILLFFFFRYFSSLAHWQLKRNDRIVLTIGYSLFISDLQFGSKSKRIGCVDWTSRTLNSVFFDHMAPAELSRRQSNGTEVVRSFVFVRANNPHSFAFDRLYPLKTVIFCSVFLPIEWWFRLDIYNPNVNNEFQYKLDVMSECVWIKFNIKKRKKNTEKLTHYRHGLRYNIVTY